VLQLTKNRVERLVERDDPTVTLETGHIEGSGLVGGSSRGGNDSGFGVWRFEVELDSHVESSRDVSRWSIRSLPTRSHNDGIGSCPGRCFHRSSSQRPDRGKVVDGNHAYNDTK